MSKIETNKLNQIDVKLLNKNNVFAAGLTGEISWPNSKSIGFHIPENKNYLDLFYKITHKNLKEVFDFTYRINLLKTPCYFGGFRYWFECPVLKNGIQCKRRVGILYQYEGIFGCRHCHNLTYSVRNLSGMNKVLGYAFKFSNIEPNKYFYYKGKPTKKCVQYFKRESRADSVYLKGLIMLNKKIDKWKNL